MGGVTINNGPSSTNPPAEGYISAYDTGTYTLTTPMAEEKMQYGVVTLSNGITISGPNNTDIVFAQSGLYNLQFSAQVTCGTPQAHLFYVWLCKNSTPVQDTCSVYTIHGTHGGNNGHMIAALNFFIQAAAGENFQLCWTADDAAIKLETIAPPLATIPQSPAIILTIQKI
jgi:hypothetical protein